MKFRKQVLIPLIVFGLFTAFMVSAQGHCQPGQPASGALCNPIAGATTLKELALKILIVFAGFTTLIPIMAVVFAGFQMLISQGNPESIQKAKQTLTWTIYGFVLAICSYIIIAATIKFLGAENLNQIDPNSPAPTVVNPLGSADFTVFLKNLLLNFLGIVGVLAILMIIFNGFRYMTAGGNEEQTTIAKDGLKWSVAGVITIVLAYVIIRATATLFGLK
ncbi:MAG: pilin [Candidatus Doudnabacteria bacterium]